MANINNGTVTVQVVGGVGPYQYTLLNAGTNQPIPNNAYPTFQNPVNNIVSNTFTFGNATDNTGNSGLAPGQYKVKIIDSNLCETVSNTLFVTDITPIPPTATPVPVPTATILPTATAIIPTATPVPDPTATEVIPTATPVPAPTATAIPDPTATPVPDPTATEVIPTATPVPDPTATEVPVPTATEVIPTATPVPDPTATEVIPTATPVPDPTATEVPAPTATAIPDPTATPVPAPTATAIPAPTATPVPAPTATSIPEPTATPVPAPTATSIPEPTATPVPEGSSTFWFHWNGNGGYPGVNSLTTPSSDYYLNDNTTTTNFDLVFVDMLANEGTANNVEQIYFDTFSAINNTEIPNGTLYFAANVASSQRYYIAIPKSVSTTDYVTTAKFADAANGIPFTFVSKLDFTHLGNAYTLYEVFDQPLSGALTLNVV
jgi:hypothetical protein